MKHVYMVQIDWSNDDDMGLETHLFKSYKKAYAHYQQNIQDELNPQFSWVGNEAFDKEGNLNYGYELQERGNPKLKTNLSRNISCSTNGFLYTFISLIKKELL